MTGVQTCALPICEGIESAHLTTNGLLLSKQIDNLEKSGLSGINISLDTLNPEKFKIITRRNGLDLVLNSLHKAMESTIQSIKLNVVALRGFNDDELMDFVDLTEENDITVRFIELMPFDSHQIWKRSEEHTSELQSRTNLVCRLLLEKKKKKYQ